MYYTVGRPVLVAAAVAGLAIGVGHGTAAAQLKSDAHVKATATPDKQGPDGKQVITIKLTIDKGWHTYANPSGEQGTPTVVTVEGKKAEDVKIEYPEGKLIKDKDVGNYSIWEDSAAIKVTVPRSKDDSPVKLKVKFQVCNDMTCLVPATTELSVP